MDLGTQTKESISWTVTQINLMLFITFVYRYNNNQLVIRTIILSDYLISMQYNSTQVSSSEEMVQVKR